MDAQLGAEAEAARAPRVGVERGGVVDRRCSTPSTGGADARRGATRARAANGRQSSSSPSPSMPRSSCRSIAPKASRCTPRSARDLAQPRRCRRRSRSAAAAMRPARGATRARASARSAFGTTTAATPARRARAQVVVEPRRVGSVDAHDDRGRLPTSQAASAARAPSFAPCGDGVLEVDDDRVGAARQRLRVALRAGRPGRTRYERGDIIAILSASRKRDAARSCAATHTRSITRAHLGAGRAAAVGSAGARPCPRAPAATAVLPGSPLGSSTRASNARPSVVSHRDLADPARRVRGVDLGVELHRTRRRANATTVGSRQCASNSVRPGAAVHRDQAEHRAHRELRLVHASADRRPGRARRSRPGGPAR